MIRTINLTAAEQEAIKMSLLDYVCTSKSITKKEKEQCLYLVDEVSVKSTIKIYDYQASLLCASLIRYATRYDYEYRKARDCKRTYNMILEAFRHE